MSGWLGVAFCILANFILLQPNREAQEGSSCPLLLTGETDTQRSEATPPESLRSGGDGNQPVLGPCFTESEPLCPQQGARPLESHLQLP